VPRVAARAFFWPIVQTSGVVERNSLLERARAALTTDDRLVGVRPELQYVSGFVPSGGLRLFYRRLPGAGTEAGARFRTGGPDVVLAEVGLRGPTRLGFELRSAWDRRKDRLFAGVGSATRAELEGAGRGVARYGADTYLVEGRWSSPRLGPLSLLLRSDWQGRRYDADDVRGGPSVATLYGAAPEACAARGVASPCVDPLLVPGFDGGRRIVHEGARLTLDLREDARDGDGVYMAVEGTYGRGVAGDAAHHVRLAGETVLAIGGLDRVLLLRGAAAAVEPLGSAQVPFDELVSPTGSAGMRGFPDGRLRDRSGLVGTIEYRWLIAHRLDASLFVDQGAVAQSWFSGLRLASFFPSVGVGVRRFETRTGQYWRGDVDLGVQLAYSPEAGARLLLSAAGF
jgi:hypothetical protein